MLLIIFRIYTNLLIVNFMNLLPGKELEIDVPESKRLISIHMKWHQLWGEVRRFFIDSTQTCIFW